MFLKALNVNIYANDSYPPLQESNMCSHKAQNCVGLTDFLMLTVSSTLSLEQNNAQEKYRYQNRYRDDYLRLIIIEGIS